MVYPSRNSLQPTQVVMEKAVKWVLLLRTRGVCWFEVLLSTHLWLLEQLDWEEDARVLINSFTYTNSIPYVID